MKKVIIDTLKNYKWRILIQTIFLALNIYLLTIPSKIIGEIVDMLYNLDENKQNILNSTYYLLGICIQIVDKVYKNLLTIFSFFNLFMQLKI